MELSDRPPPLIEDMALGAVDGRVQFLGRPSASHHIVQFYERDEFLCTTLAHFLGAGLAAGECLIAVVTDEHREFLQRELQANGFDVARILQTGQLTLFDAHEALSEIIVGSLPDPARLEAFAERILTQTKSAEGQGPKLRIHGEVVDLLCKAGNTAAALQLEAFWHGLVEAHGFTLLCSYALASFDEVGDARSFERVCRTHSHVFPTESYSELLHAGARFRQIGILQQRALALAHEVERRNELETRLREALEREVAHSRMKDEFLAIVSHELRTPLNAILGWAAMMRIDPELDVKHAMETIERNARFQSRLIGDLLDVSRIITGKLKIERHPIDLAHVLQSALDVISPSAEAKAITIDVHIDREPCPFYGDADRLQQVFWNLLSNAIKFTPRDGRIDVRLRRVASSMEVRVADTGRGIAPEFLPHVFERFRQADPSITRSERGLGLGLALVGHLVEMHGGTIDVASEGLGHGATVTVTLPIPAVSAELAQPKDAPSTEASRPSIPDQSQARAAPTRVLEALRVLVCEDDEDARDLVAYVLESAGAEVLPTATAMEALAALEGFRPDVLVSDIGLPNLDGYAFMRQIRALPEDKGGRTPAIALTAYARGQDARKAILAGYQLHLAKPVEPGELIAMVANLAGRLTE
ncbi:ATP-binding protein [Pendulispora albinea]|uniref:histidine kinase n=1 Tax=Pendulispora albinea TaxID=2741071 RepID=A0ABZ2LXW1_9BACT